MHRLLLLVVLWIASIQAYAVEVREIIAGQKTTIDTYPWMVSIWFDYDGYSDQGCGGTLIAPDWVLTAGHCFLDAEGTQIDWNLVGSTEIVLNSTNLSPLDPEAQQRTIEQLVVHPSYQPNSYWNQNDFDMALIKLSQPVYSIEPISLSASDSLAAGDRMRAMGWGATAVGAFGESTDYSNTLKEVDLQYVTFDECLSIYGYGITGNMLCAGGFNNTNDTCQGDSGGPLVIEGQEGWVQVGVTSFGEGCGNPEIPGVYANVAALQTFIQSYVPNAQFASMVDHGNASTEACLPELDAGLNVQLNCLVVDGQAYQTSLLYNGDWQWKWSGQLLQSNCPIDYQSCTHVAPDLGLSIPQISYSGNTFTAHLLFNNRKSTLQEYFWNLAWIE